MNELEQRLLRIEKILVEVLESVHSKTSPPIDKWLTAPQVMSILNLSKRGLAEIRRKNLIRSSSATGRNFKYYKADVERYLYENSSINKRTSSKNP